MAIADNGKGILKSFQEVGLDIDERMTHQTAILHALEPKVSCKGEPINQGVGLTLVSGLARLTEAWLMIVSGNGVIQSHPKKGMISFELENNGHYQGTLVALAFKQASVRSFASVLEQAKIEAGLLHKQRISSRFVQ